MKISPLLTNAAILSLVLQTSSADAKSPIGRYEIIRIGVANDDSQPIGKINSISPLKGIAYYEYNSDSSVQFGLYGMIDPLTNIPLAADAKCEAGTLLTGSAGYSVLGVSDEDLPTIERYPNISGTYPITSNGKIGHFKFELITSQAGKTATNGEKVDVCARVYTTVSTAASINITTAPSISTAPSIASSTAPSVSTVPSIISSTAPSIISSTAPSIKSSTTPSIGPSEALISENAGGTCFHRDVINSFRVQGWVSVVNNDPVSTCENQCTGYEYFGMECPATSLIVCNCLNIKSLSESILDQKDSIDFCRWENKGCPGLLINGVRLPGIFDGYALGAAGQVAVYPTRNRRELQEVTNTVVSYLDTRFQITRTFNGSFDLKDVKIADAETNNLNREHDVEVEGVTVKFCDAGYSVIDQFIEYKLGQDFGVCVDPPDQESDSLFRYTVTKLKDVKCVTNNDIFPLIDSKGTPTDDLTIINGATLSNGKRFISVVQPAYFANGNTRLDCDGRVELVNDRTGRKLEANIRLAIPSQEDNALVARGMQEGATQEGRFGFGINLDSDEPDEASAGVYGGYSGITTAIAIGVAFLASLVL